jgi:hypothetical protein
MKWISPKSFSAWECKQSTWGLYNRPEVAAVPRDLVSPHKKKAVNMMKMQFAM